MAATDNTGRLSRAILINDIARRIEANHDVTIRGGIVTSEPAAHHGYGASKPAPAQDVMTNAPAFDASLDAMSVQATADECKGLAVVCVVITAAIIAWCWGFGL